MHALYPYYGSSFEYFLQVTLVQSDRMFLNKMEDLYPYLAMVYWWTGLDLLANIYIYIYVYIYTRTYTRNSIYNIARLYSYIEYSYICMYIASYIAKTFSMLLTDFRWLFSEAGLHEGTLAPLLPLLIDCIRLKTLLCWNSYSIPVTCTFESKAFRLKML